MWYTDYNSDLEPRLSMTKRCNVCEENLPVTAFHNKKGVKDGKQGTCIECMKVRRKNLPEESKERHRGYSRNWRKNNPQRAAYVDFKNSIRIYNLTPEQYYVMLWEQDNKCAICGVEADPNKRLAVDHDHSCCPGDRSCGKCVRALLCHLCNRGLGVFRDNEEVLMRAAKYLTTHREMQVVGEVTVRPSTWMQYTTSKDNFTSFVHKS